MKLLTFILSLFLIITSCKKEESCPLIECNSGIQNESNCLCDCLTGFSGSNCEKEDLCITRNIECINNGNCINGICECPEGYLGENCESFDNTKIQLLLDSGKTPLELFNANVPLDSIYGKIYEGGLIFFIDVDDELPEIEGMVANIQEIIDNQGYGYWGLFNYDSAVPNVDEVPLFGSEIELKEGARIGDGITNTKLIIMSAIEINFTEITLAQLCDEFTTNNYDDWFLPSIGELRLMNLNLHKKGHGAFINNREYWSSTEKSTEEAWFISIGQDEPSWLVKLLPTLVRAARIF